MTNIIAAEPLIQSPLVVTLIGVLAAAFLGTLGAALRMVIQLTKLTAEVFAIRSDISDLKGDPDVMRWSNYGRASQAFQRTQHDPGVTP